MLREQREVNIPLEVPAGLAEGKRESKGDTPVKAPRAGDLCPHCQEGRLDYDGLLNLACSRCGFALGGCFT